MKKFLFLTQDFPPPFVGGSLILFFHIYNNYPHNQFAIFTHNQFSAQFDDNLNIIRKSYILPSCETVSWLRKLTMIIRWTMDVTWYLWRNNVKNLYVGQAFPTGLISVFLNKFFRVRYYLYVMGEEISTISNLKGIHRLRAISIQICVRHAAQIITISQFSRDALIEIGANKDLIQVINPPIDKERYKLGIEVSSIKEKYGLDSENILLTVGRLTKRKGHAMVIQSMPTVIQEYPDLMYLIVGDGNEREDLFQLIQKLGLEGHVRLLGQVEEEEIPQFYSLCDVFVMPNRTLDNGDTEGYGLVFLEANACGKPVIGGKAGGVPDAIIEGETGFLVNGNDESEIAEKIILLLSNPKFARRLGQNGHDRVEKMPDWKEIARRIDQMAVGSSIGN